MRKQKGKKKTKHKDNFNFKPRFQSVWAPFLFHILHIEGRKPSTQTSVKDRKPLENTTTKINFELVTTEF